MSVASASPAVPDTEVREEARLAGAARRGRLRTPVDLEVVIPAYNESARLPDTLRRSAAYLDERPWRSRIVVVDNGSVDETAADARLAVARTDRVDVAVIGCSRRQGRRGPPGAADQHLPPGRLLRRAGPPLPDVPLRHRARPRLPWRPGAAGGDRRRGRRPRAGHRGVRPLGVGRHVDHLLARAVGEHLGAVLYADFPHTVRDPRAEGAGAGGRRPWAWVGDPVAKRSAVAGYRTQVDALLPDGEIPLRPETYYAPPSRAAASRAGLR